MEEDIREKIALKRYQLISPVLAEPARAQNEYLRKQAGQELTFPRYGDKQFRHDSWTIQGGLRYTGVSIREWKLYYLDDPFSDPTRRSDF